MKSVLIYLVRGIALVFLVSAFAFALASKSPVDPVRAYIQANPGVSKENVARMEEYWGLHDPPLQRYGKWLRALLSGDWGESTTFRQPVLYVIGVRFRASLALMIASWILTGVLGFTMGCVMGLFRNTLVDAIFKRVCLVLCSIPTFWIGLVFLSFFAAVLGWFPFGLAMPAGIDPWAVTIAMRIRHLVLPALTLSFLSFANLALHTREKLIDVYESDYALFARARGESDGKILVAHGIRNALIPGMTMQFASFAELFGGSIFAERIFSYPGLGAAVSAAGTGSTDIPLFLGIVVFSSCFIFVGNLIANVLNVVIDPRTREGARA